MAKRKTKDASRSAMDLCWDFIGELEDASQRAKAIVAAAALDEILARMLEQAILDQKVAEKLVRGGNTALPTFSARIDVAFGFGVIDINQHQLLHIIRDIRNQFAHVVNWSFSEQSTADKCLSMNMDYIVYPEELEFDPETRFVQTASGLCGQLQQILVNWRDLSFDPRWEHMPQPSMRQRRDRPDKGIQAES